MIFALAGNQNCGKTTLINALVLGCAYRNNGNTEVCRKLFNIDSSAVVSHFVHHIQRKHCRNVHFEKLEREVKISLDIRCINDVDYRIRLLFNKKITGDYLFICIRSDRVNTGKVNNFTVFESADTARFAVNGNAGEVSDVLI